MCMLTLCPLQAALQLAFCASATAVPPAAPDAVAGAEDIPEQPDAASNTLEVVEVTGSAVNTDYKASSSTIGAKMPTALRDIPQSVTVIERAQTAGIVTDSGRMFAFRHAVIRDVILAELSVVRRQRVHHDVVLVLLKRWPL